MNDLGLLFNNNRALILGVLVLAFIVLPSIDDWREGRRRADYDALYMDPRLAVIDGENIKSTNSTDFWIEKNEETFNGKYLALRTDKPSYLKFVSFKYIFSVDQDGLYKIFIAGSPPGPLIDRVKQGINFSPYEVIVDGGAPIEVSLESKRSELERVFGNYFYEMYVYAAGMTFTKAGEVRLSAGPHTIEFRVSKRELYQGKLAFLLDAVIMIPADWKRERKFFTLPDDAFSY